MTKSVRSAEVRAETYRVLAACYCPPDAELLRNLQVASASASSPFAALAGHVPEQAELGQLLVEHARLFVGPFKLLAPPYGSVYLDNGEHLMGESTMDVRSRYRSEGLDLAIREVCDHISVELEFLHYLVCREGEAQHLEKAAVLRDRQVGFLQAHLGRWLPDFSARVRKSSPTSVYARVAEISERFVGEEMECSSQGKCSSCSHIR